MTFDLTKTTEVNLTKDFILSKVKEEEIWSHYGVPITKGLFCSPLRKDKNPTVSIYRNRSGRLIMKDFGTNWSGDCFAYVSELYNISFYEALQIIANDFGLIKLNIEKHKPKIKYNGEEIKANSAAIIQVEIRPFQQYELDWWARYGISEKTLKKYNVFSCKNVWLNGNLFHLEKDKQLVFGYYGGVKDGIELWRIYFPHRRSKSLKFISNWPASKIQGAKQLDTKNTDFVVIQKSMKDLLLMHEYGIPSIAPNSENTPISDKTLRKLQEKYKKVIFWYDGDPPGLESLRKIKEIHPEVICYNLNIETQAKDISDFRKVYGKKATDKLIEEFKEFVNGQTNKTTETWETK